MYKIVSLGLIILFMAACKSGPSASKHQSPLPQFSTEGHRGARGLMPENTIPAMRKAIDLGVTTLEMDAHITRDKEVVLAHDDYINHLFMLSPEGKEISKEEAENMALYQMDYAEVRRFDVGSKFHTGFPQQQKLKTYIPRLAEVIDSVQTYLKAKNKPPVFYNIETKSKPAGDNRLHPDPENFVNLLMGVIQEKKITPWVIIQSFDLRTLQVLHQKYPQVRTSFLVQNNKPVAENLQELGFTPTVYSPNLKMVTPSLVKDSHDRGMKVVPWTANTAEEIAKLKALGVDGIISDYPNLLVAAP
ncbi:glycerophosphoryl diester phosphodiesterase [Adhaeribacter aerolatus]|uniref:Glycerophosphoryl diester phosphodiesterase n=1 Tax=Adhaeribacter aerolatus TaxID=670289 RepID=A0A512AZR6_9BACT|nr:glycerophosphodiester phosphodiesterase family protein [Adhaeribacter aerolatus]GEO05194.1 glycerophosphoryl diester phosphodiesterase [Adhaeribacter aerolatus]